MVSVGMSEAVVAGVMGAVGVVPGQFGMGCTRSWGVFAVVVGILAGQVVTQPLPGR